MTNETGSASHWEVEVIVRAFLTRQLFTNLVQKAKIRSAGLCLLESLRIALDNIYIHI